MEYPLKVQISNRHVHLTKEVYYKLFNEEISKKRDLNQVGEFASNQVLTIKNGDKEIENVRLVGPFRPYNQVEISKRDARLLGLNPPVRRSGDLADSLNITLKTDLGEVEVKGLIIANRHIHMTKADSIKYNVQDREIVQVKISGEKSGIIDAEVKISDNGYYEMHIDTDDANAFLLENNSDVTMITR